MLPEIHIVYASASGNVEAVCEKINEILSANRIASFLYRAEVTPPEIIEKNNFFIFAASTWEHGVLNPYFKEVLKQIETGNMLKKYAAFVGLGDTRYEPVLFCAGIEELKDKFTRAGGKQVGTTLKINGNPYQVLDSIVADWSEQMILQIRRYAR